MTAAILTAVAVLAVLALAALRRFADWWETALDNAMADLSADPETAEPGCYDAQCAVCRIRRPA
jgi:hypothetical protein